MQLRYGDTAYTKSAVTTKEGRTLHPGAPVRIVYTFAKDGNVLVDWQGKYLEVPPDKLERRRD